MDTMHPGAHNCTEVVLAEYRNSHLIASIFCHDLKMEIEDLVLEVYKERKMYDQLFKREEIWQACQADQRFHLNLGVINLEQTSKYGCMSSSYQIQRKRCNRFESTCKRVLEQNMEIKLEKGGGKLEQDENKSKKLASLPLFPPPFSFL